jgi:hypothetical protein
MAFGQQSGRPATARQLQELLALLQAAGYSDFRDARGPLGFTQRQGGGKFNSDEADAFIEQLQAAAEATTDEAPAPPAPVKRAAPKATAAKPVAATQRSALTANEQAIRRIPTEQLAAELQRRGWIVVEP